MKSARWKKKRMAVFAHYGKRCYACRKRPKVLHVHHLTYARLGRESIKDLIPLCVPCHREVTRIYKKNRRRGLGRVTMEFVKVKRLEIDNARRVRTVRKRVESTQTRTDSSGTD